MKQKSKIITGIILALSAAALPSNGDPAQITIKVLLAIMAVYLIGNGLKKQKV